MKGFDFSFSGMIHQMSLLAKIVGIILTIMSIWSVSVLIDRFFAFRASRRQSLKAINEAYERLDEGRVEEAVEATRKHPRANLARIMGAALASSLQDKRRGTPPDLDAADRAVEKERGQVIAGMRKGLTSLATIAATAPFIGLFGTVIGIINAFVGMAATGSGGLGAVSAGISEALITTAFGLAVAIPAVWFFNYFNSRVEELHTDIDTVKAEVLDRIVRPVAAEAHGGRKV